MRSVLFSIVGLMTVSAAHAGVECESKNTGEVKITHSLVAMEQGKTGLKTRVEIPEEQPSEEAIEVASLEQSAGRLYIKTITTNDDEDRPTYLEISALPREGVYSGSGTIYTSTDDGQTFTRRFAWSLDCKVTE